MCLSTSRQPNPSPPMNPICILLRIKPIYKALFLAAALLVLIAQILWIRYLFELMTMIITHVTSLLTGAMNGSFYDCLQFASLLSPVIMGLIAIFEYVHRLHTERDMIRITLEENTSKHDQLAYFGKIPNPLNLYRDAETIKIAFETPEGEILSKWQFSRKTGIPANGMYLVELKLIDVEIYCHGVISARVNSREIEFGKKCEIGNISDQMFGTSKKPLVWEIERNLAREIEINKMSHCFPIRCSEPVRRPPNAVHTDELIVLLENFEVYHFLE